MIAGPAVGATTRTRLSLFAAFAGLGVTASFIPALLPTSERALGAELTAVVPLLFSGLLLGVLASGPLLTRWSLRSVLLAGCGLQALAIVGAACAAAPAVFLAAGTLAGVGFGLVEAAGSVAAKTVSSGSATGLLSALTGGVAVAAALTPLLVAAGSALPPALSALALVPLAAAALSARMPHARQESAEVESRPRERGGTRSALLALLPFAIALPLYVGVETLLSGWSAVIPGRALALDPAAAALGTSAFWALMALGRFGATALRHRDIPPRRILGAATIAAAVLLACAGGAVTTVPVLALIAAAAAVVALAPSYGLILGLALDRIDTERSASVTGALVACGAVGGSLVPTVVLLLGQDPSGPGTFFFAALVCALVPILAARKG